MTNHHIAVLIAQEAGDGAAGSIDAISQRVRDLLMGIQGLLLEIGGGIIILSLIFAGFKYITGDPKSGKAGITAAIIGTAIVILSYAIIGFICEAGGASC
jgi:hypothetical protein